MAANHYSLSFTTGATLIWEAIDVAVLKCELGSWAAVKASVLEHNTFQCRTDSTLKKLYGEVSRRLQHLSDIELNLLANGSESAQKQLLWLAICRHYYLIKDFALEVLCHQYDTARYAVKQDDYNAFFNAKAEWHDNLDSASQQTKNKARQVLFKMLRECGLINEYDEIVPQQIAPAVLALLQNASLPNNRMEDLSIFPGVGN